MEASTKLALAVVGAAAILIGGYIAYSEWSRARDEDQAQQALEQLQRSGQQVVAQYHQSMQQDQRQVADALARQAAYERSQQDRRRLALNQRCVGGVVVQVQGNVYTQLGTIAQPIHCDGLFADRPLR